MRTTISLLLFLIFIQSALAQSTPSNTPPKEKFKHKIVRKPRKANQSEDAFISASNTNKNTPSNTAKGKRKKVKKKRQMEKPDSAESAAFTPSKKERKRMKNQKKKKMYGLGLPRK